MLVIYCLVILFRQVITFQHNLQLSNLLTHENVLFVLMLSLIHLLSLNLLGIAWYSNLAIASPQLKKWPLIAIYGYTQLAKYLPGNIFHFAGRQLFANKLGIQQLDVFKATLREIIAHLVSSMLVIFVLFLLSLFFVESLKLIQEKFQLMVDFVYSWQWIFLSLVITMLSITWFFKHYLLDKLKGLFTSSFFLFIAFHLISASLFVLTLYWFGKVDVHFLFLTMLSYVLAWVIGYVVPGAPGGVGVREVVLLLMLNGVYPQSLLLIAVLINRLITTLADFYFFGQACWIKQYHHDK